MDSSTFLMIDTALLPDVFGFLIALTLLIYIVLDGYDLGVGILSIAAEEKKRDRMIDTIAPFWDANETWILLALGIIIVAFPAAQGIVFGALYLPTAIMLIALLFRGAAFEFRVKASPKHKPLWDKTLFAGSLIVALSQGWMLGLFVSGFEYTAAVWLMPLLAVAAYVLVGACWLIMKTTGSLRQQAVSWAKTGIRISVLLAAVIAIASPLFPAASISAVTIFSGISAVLAFAVVITLARLGKMPDKGVWVPFALTVLIFILGVAILSLSCYPDIIRGHMSLVEGAASTASLSALLLGVVISLPLVIVYTVIAYRIFHGANNEIHYDD